MTSGDDDKLTREEIEKADHTICFDFDGVVHKMGAYKRVFDIKGTPVKGVFKYIEKLLDNDWHVAICGVDLY